MRTFWATTGVLSLASCAYWNFLMCWALVDDRPYADSRNTALIWFLAGLVSLKGWSDERRSSR